MVPHHKTRWLRLILTALGSGVAFGVIAWIKWTHDLHYNVYSDDEFWYREDFPLYFNVIVTILFSLVFGLITAAAIWIIRYSMREMKRD
jgi:Mg/Co/Ni transporter MgtE